MTMQQNTKVIGKQKSMEMARMDFVPAHHAETANVELHDETQGTTCIEPAQISREL